MGSVFDGDDTIAGILWVTTSIAATNWGLVEFFDVNLIAEIVTATSPEVGTALYAIIGIAGVLTLADNLGAYDVTDVVDKIKGDDN
ncbi:hypothetical protein HRPV12-gp02 [Halorubrum pleomorphic virus 12]|uniref:DUF378 domain-containing protein n=1 Tax=Halorubrum pleomorphic virus 12 TaxID=2507578 RepID=A0A410N6M4_9VIRU|nr:hypothetical protein HOV13_gp02 [Halorubrum pleomorphic virus 12]QAS68806.1 hypothetical protein HRPV12-gp02 [Halorubrum pleomorphic virus 12]